MSHKNEVHKQIPVKKDLPKKPDPKPDPPKDKYRTIFTGRHPIKVEA